jgi:tRNA pseudouridine55 synthase
MTLGGVSDTQDAWGEIIYQPNAAFNSLSLKPILEKYTGIIKQIPPMYSAVHHQGARLYELARKGIVVEREAREIEIDYIELLAKDVDSEGRPLIKIEVGCSKGTYIRTLCHDIGRDLGTGAYLSELTRIRAGVFAINDALSIEEIRELAGSLSGLIKGIDYPLGHIEQLTINSPDLDRICNGNRIVIDEKLLPGLIRLYDPRGNLISIAESNAIEDRTILQPLKVFKPGEV